MNNTIKFNSSFSGEYLVQVVKADGSINYPFGNKKRKNLILDTFFDAILNGGYSYGSQAYIQSCRVGGGPGSDIPANRTQSGLQGQQVMITHLGDLFTATAPSSPNFSIKLQRDFAFDVNNTVNPISCREATIGCFDSSINGMDITLSRFVFPSDIVINNGEQLRISYTLDIRLRYLYEDVPVIMSSNGLDLTGAIRFTGQSTALFNTAPGSIGILITSPGLTTIIGQNGHNAGTSASNYYYRRYNVGGTNSNTFLITTANSLAGGTNNMYGLPVPTFWGATYNNTGFFTSSDLASLTTYPSAKPSTWTVSGPRPSYSLSNYNKTDASASIDVNYFFPSHSSNRTVAGAYLWNITATSNMAIYIRFTESDFITNRNLEVPAGTPIAFKLRYTFSRE